MEIKRANLGRKRDRYLGQNIWKEKEISGLGPRPSKNLGRKGANLGGGGKQLGMSFENSLRVIDMISIVKNCRVARR